MSKRLETEDPMESLKTLLMFTNAIIGGSGVSAFFSSLSMRDYLRDYMNMSVQGSGAAIADAALLVFAGLGASLVVLPFVTFFACFCNARRLPALLYLNGAFLAVVELVGFGVAVTVYSYYTYYASIYERFDQGLNESMAAYGQNNSRSSHIDTMQSILKCCGNRGYADWLNLDPPKDIPFSCCKMSQDKCDSQDPEQINTQGCYNLVLDFISESISLVGSTSIGMVILPIGIYLACYLASNINKVEQRVKYMETDPGSNRAADPPALGPVRPRVDKFVRLSPGSSYN